MTKQMRSASLAATEAPTRVVVGKGIRLDEDVRRVIVPRAIAVDRSVTQLVNRLIRRVIAAGHLDRYSIDDAAPDGK